MKMPGQNAKSLELLRQSLAAAGFAAEQKKMFGHETYFLRGYMFAGVFGDDIFVHVGLETVEASQKEGVGYFEPMGKRMRSYLTLPPHLQTPEQITRWLVTSSNYLKKLPDKSAEKKSGSKKTAAKKKSTRAPKASAGVKQGKKKTAVKAKKTGRKNK